MKMFTLKHTDAYIDTLTPRGTHTLKKKLHYFLYATFYPFKFVAVYISLQIL